MHQEVVLGKPRGDAVVEHHALFVEHETVAAAPYAELRPPIDVDAVQKRRRVRPPDVDLAEGRRVEDPGRAAHGEALPIDRVAHRLAGPGVVPGALPLADVLELRPGLAVPIVHRRLPDRVEELAQIPARHCAEGDRRVWLSERRSPYLRDRPVEYFGERADPVDRTRPALVRTHPQCGVALDVLDQLVPLAGGDGYVSYSRVGLEVDESLAVPLRRTRSRHDPAGARRGFLMIVGFRDG